MCKEKKLPCDSCGREESYNVTNIEKKNGVFCVDCIDSSLRVPGGKYEGVCEGLVCEHEDCENEGTRYVYFGLDDSATTCSCEKHKDVIKPLLRTEIR